MPYAPRILISPSAAINNLLQSALRDGNFILEWVPYSEISDITPTQTDSVYCAIYKRINHVRDTNTITLVFLGNSTEITQTFVNKFARIYSLPTHKYNNNVSQYRRY